MIPLLLIVLCFGIWGAGGASPLYTLPPVIIIAVVLALPDKATRYMKKPIHLMVVLGSGGHTAEMFHDLGSLPNWTTTYRATYVVADTDRGSGDKAHDFESLSGNRKARIVRIPRAREVGQSYFTSIFTTLKSLLVSVWVVLREMPDIVVCNGPGTCVPICLAAYIPRVLRIKRIGLVYSESITCVHHLSLSGRILYRLVDRMTVQWDELADKCPRTQRACRIADRNQLPPLPNDSTSGLCVITVGSTKFDQLIEAVDTEAMAEALRDMDISRVIVQKGRGEYYPTKLAKDDKLQVEVMDYANDLPAKIREASLVISHAGGGTILDCLNSKRRLIVVPNEALMNNHQVQLAEQLQRYQLLLWGRPKDLVSLVKSIRTADLKEYPSQPSATFKNCLESLAGM